MSKVRLKRTPLRSEHKPSAKHISYPKKRI
uniref:Uncharacterized protein n=1 Tax=Arundo donax TaxID=35708 RepID=A0A0A9H9S1_ARUDO